ncbi:MAG TPA: sulfatase-like hydrolase/transferase [Verrucomicrobiae bacterium]|nr:sulfatase-like hydrolase/transferase [Verrucomicrobiae bacterium]
MKHALALVLGLVALPLRAADAGPTRPNIIIILADDLGYGEPACYGGDIPTPHIDSLARNGVRFTDAYVTAPFCAASRSSLLTGRYGTRFGFEFNPLGPKNAEPGIGLPLTERTLADALREAGYATALVGKWHLGGTAPFHPQRRGFDEFFGFLHEGHYYVPLPWAEHVTWLRRKTLPDGTQGRWTSPDGRVVWSTHLGRNEDDYDADNPLLRSGQPIDERANLTEAFTREAKGFIERHRAQPFFLYLAYNAVHSPMQAPDRYLQRFAGIADIHRRIFAAMLTLLDDGIGRVIEKLRACEIEERTLIVFLSDNGGPTSELTSSNLPLRGGKGQFYEGGVRVPLILQWKGRLPAGRVESRAAGSLDLFPTALAAAGGRTDAKLDGVDLMPRLTAPDGTPIRETHFWRVGGQAAMRHGNWKIVRQRGGAWELYDLAGDIAETRDLASQQTDRLRELKVRWEQWNAEQVAPAWEPTGRKVK